jgi:hypothetical protein
VLFYVLFVCNCVLPPDDNPIAVNKYIISFVQELRAKTTRAFYTSHRMHLAFFNLLTLPLVWRSEQNTKLWQFNVSFLKQEIGKEEAI